MISNSPGVGPEPLEGPGAVAASLVAFQAETYQTPLIDISQPLSGMELIPARPGHFPVLLNALYGVWDIESVTGTQTSPVHLQAGNNAAHTNMFASTTTPSNGDVNGANVPSLTFLNATFNIAAPATQIPNATVFLDVTVPAAGTGGFKCMARLSVTVVWFCATGALI